MDSSTSQALLNQWRNPADILSLLLLIGGNIVQMAIAQLVGYCTCRDGYRAAPKSPGRRTSLICIPLTPVAFSFGWVALGVSLLFSSVGDKKLLPAPERSSIVINCANAFQRENKSWVLERLLRDHELSTSIDRTTDSIRIDIFELGPLQKVKTDFVWWLGWLVIVAQIAVAIVPWVLYGDWGVMMVVLSGNLLASVTCALPQWKDEKWPVRGLKKDNVICLTRGNGHMHVMVFIGSPGSPDLEAFATSSSEPRLETTPILVIISALWVCLLLSVIALKNHSWYMVGTGAMGMAQNVYSAGVARDPATAGLQLTEFQRKKYIVGKYLPFTDDADAEVDLNEALAGVAPLENWMKDDKCNPDKIPKWLKTMNKYEGVPPWLEPAKTNNDVFRVQGGRKELEKWVPTAGLALLHVFFPGSL
ncbi:uncharacterized protein K460DRAFT_376942 [Cucurbitaria berberidis CBS 394.84]|uniref:Uncharacterized protein n=1 Tax=Cucurbitaria berberidis CBS 394.84 TaxID=1168544 RepID=A0A9P4GI34_9PLEO|nr:uncharacterized protein K460DRAFT_376942 [Cucurbitaria berberidis CBS 394.84]KAF1845530.1 hypothetical protein K460DRAFT_376942 [Cucurbitaria berberidis CBS 394.84]